MDQVVDLTDKLDLAGWFLDSPTIFVKCVVLVLSGGNFNLCVKYFGNLLNVHLLGDLLWSLELAHVALFELVSAEVLE